MKITTAEEMRQIDRVTGERHGVPSLTLMENAGTHVSDYVLRRYPRAQRICVVCGKGNNGGDGFVAARKLHEAGKKVDVLLLGDPAEVKGDAAAMLAKLPLAPLVIRSEEELKDGGARSPLTAMDARARSPSSAMKEADLILDAILGTGFKPPVTGLFAAAIELINALPVPAFAVDIPSGASADAFAPEPHLRCRADAIVTFTAPRPAHVFADLTRGEIVVGQIGSPPEAIQSQLNLDVIAWPDIKSCFAPRAPDANKGNFGHVLTIGGSLGKSGAAAMAGMAALRAGAGLSTVATPRCVLPMVAGFAAELMTEPLAETEAGTISLAAIEYGRLDAIVAGKTVLALGPGISRHPDTVQFIRAIVGTYPQPLVIDADGLNAFAGLTERLEGSTRPLVVTPHPGEMARLAGISTKQVQQDRIGVARSFARDHHCIVVLKGHRTLVAEPDGHVWVNMTGNPGMATGGTGDVLTGLIAGMIAQFPNDLVQAVCAAVWLHGYAGDRAATLGEQYMAATDLLFHCWIDSTARRKFAKDPFVSIHDIGNIRRSLEY
ncbi:MAG: NAD(P)H-hydrate dehydratase [Acidobacteriia bacterium]|nr:NAD(P)H-hydrate dehydratase [Terriglobia bacterium]